MNRSRIMRTATLATLVLGTLGSSAIAQTYRSRADVYRQGTYVRSRNTAENTRRSQLHARLVQTAERVDRAHQSGRLTNREASTLSRRLDAVWNSLRNQRSLTRDEHEAHMERLREIQEDFREERTDDDRRRNGRGGIDDRGRFGDRDTYRPLAESYRTGTYYRSRNTAENTRRSQLHNRLVQTAERVDRAHEMRRISASEAREYSQRLERVWESVRNQRTLTEEEYDEHMDRLRDIQEDFRDERRDR